MRKLWTARVICLLAATGLGVVVVEERQAQEADGSLKTICWNQVEPSPGAAGQQARSGACTETRAAKAPAKR